MKFINDANMNQMGEWAKRNLDTTLVLAIATETPRWTVVFMALHEPSWIGVTMGVLISWAAKRGWNAWNKERHRHGLFALNVWVLASAVAIMAPVLLEMTKHPIEQVDVSAALLSLHEYAVWLWVLLVAQSTFMPLIQAVVAHNVSQDNEDDANRPTQKKVTRTVRNTQTVEQSEQFVVPTVQQSYAVIEQPVSEPVQGNDYKALTDNQKREQLAIVLNSEEVPSKSKLADLFGISRTTVYAWIREIKQGKVNS